MNRSAVMAGGVAAVVVVAVVGVLVLGEEGGERPNLGGSTERTKTELPRETEGDGPTVPSAGGAPRQGGGAGTDVAHGAGPREGAPTTPGGGPASPAQGASGPRGTQSGAERPPPGAVDVSFQCTDESNEVLVGVWIEVRRKSGAPAGQLVSDGAGVARLGTIPAGEAIEGVGRHPLSNQSVAFGPITVKNGSVVRLRFRRSVTGVLTGRVVDERGQGVADARLRLVDPKQAGEAVLDGLAMGLGPDGTFRATVAAGAYTVSAEAPGFASSDRAYVTVPETGQADPVELLVFRQGRVAGRVSLPPDLAAVLPARVDLVVEVTRGTTENPYERVERRPLEVDASLSFELTGCDPGRYRLRLEAPAAGGNRVGEWYALTLAAGQSIEGVTLVLKETKPAVRGVVRDDRSLPVEGAQVRVRGRESITDREGRYAIHGIDEGEDILVEARAERYAPATQQATYEGSELLIDLVLKRHGGVRGIVRATGGLEGSVPVMVCMKIDGGVRPYQIAAGADGRYLLEGLPPGSYFIKAGQGADPFDASGAPTVEVRPGEVVEAPDVVVQ